jgi:hypothetical protein
MVPVPAATELAADAQHDRFGVRTDDVDHIENPCVVLRRVCDLVIDAVERIGHGIQLGLRRLEPAQPEIDVRDDAHCVVTRQLLCELIGSPPSRRVADVEEDQSRGRLLVGGQQRRVLRVVLDRRPPGDGVRADHGIGSRHGCLLARDSKSREGGGMLARRRIRSVFRNGSRGMPVF